MAQNLSKIVKMRFLSTFMAAAALFFCLGNTPCHAQQQGQDKPVDYDEVVAKQVNDMIDRYKLDDSQAFRLDTLLQHYIPIFNEEVQRVKHSGAAQIESYQRVMDKWGDFLDSEYQKIFTEEQWKLYMKSYAGKEKKKRDKRLTAARGGGL